MSVYPILNEQNFSIKEEGVNMRKFNYICSVILIITMSLAITILSSNLILRVSATYVFHFNDSQATSEIPYYVTGSEIADGVSKYWSSFSSDKFQVYEQNGNFKDPVFNAEEQQVMQKAKNILNIELATGLLCLLLSCAIYIYLWKNQFLEALRNRFRVGIVVAGVLIILRTVLIAVKSFRRWLYGSLIGVKLAKDATLVVLLGDPFFKTYLIFATIAGAALIAVLYYVHYNLTKPSRIFY